MIIYSEKEILVDKILNRGIIKQVLPSIEEFRTNLLSDKIMRFYIGADPTSTSLHLSHAKNYMLLEEFRQLGHETIVLFGDFTARIGDPTDRTKVRKQLTLSEVQENVKKWIKQITPLMDFNAKINPPKIVYNSEWLEGLKMEGIIKLASNITVQRMLERDMFEKRIKEQKPLFLHEFMYPLLQGYDSVVLNVDVELCGTDQIFNALVGKKLLKKYKNKDKFVVAVNLMENPISGTLMSKSRGTGVFLDTCAENMYGEIMKQPDEMISLLLINNTRIPLEEVDKIVNSDNLMQSKKRTAFEIVKVFHGLDSANNAQNMFIQKFQKRETPNDIPVIFIDSNCEKAIDIVRCCMQSSVSNSEIRRLFSQNAIKINGEVCSKIDFIIDIPEEGAIIKIGKRKWFQVARKKS